MLLSSLSGEILCAISGLGFPGGLAIKNPSAMHEAQETQVQSLGREDPLEKEIATHSSILAWKIPWTKEPGRPTV